MVKKKFCIIGKDNDFIDLIKRNLTLFLGYFSEKNKTYKSISKKNWLGNHTKNNWLKIKEKFNPDVIIAIDDSLTREKLFNSIYKNNCKNFYFKKSYISQTTLSKLTKRRGIIVQDFVRIMSNVEIGNGVKIGEHSYIGANVTIKQRVKIGKGVVVGAGAVVTKNVKNFDVVAGVPARSIKN